MKCAVTIDLKYPITDSDGERITQVSVTRPTVGHLKAAGAAETDVERAAILVEEICGLTPAAVDRLDAEDMERISAEIERFFARRRRRKTGEH